MPIEGRSSRSSHRFRPKLKLRTLPKPVSKPVPSTNILGIMRCQLESSQCWNPLREGGQEEKDDTMQGEEYKERKGHNLVKDLRKSGNLVEKKGKK
ncbi:hypothetical protein Taro_041786 [Colocasia esculenta]|uniref:Uncharacterized protein n=1 Tax=Colocasia esculenta TaxID=4460 RepID=A0A843WMP2_COLES|nr:hypothetical protein [Colocasia esculenta]